ncbi:MAG: hypothetical protein NTX08_05070 [Sphingobacteriales bacterium]|nr:hypothetical protein [Sphingobacteriales bacterium]
MKQYYYSAAFVILFFFCIKSGMAQTISSQKGLTTVIFNLPKGSINVNLPNDVRPGELISGTVVTVPEGKNSIQTAKNLVNLKAYSVALDGKQVLISNAAKGFQFTLSNEKKLQIHLAIVNEQGVMAKQVNIPFSQNNKTIPAAMGCIIPSHALTNAPLRIIGQFDGNSSNTKCKLGGKELDILAENSGACFVQFPDNISGTQILQVQETGQPACIKPLSTVNMQVSADKTNLLKGEKTTLSVQVSGLQNLPDTAMLSLTNMTPAVVVMQPANNNLIFLTPANVVDGNYSNSFIIESTRSGTFTVSVDLNLPDSLPPIYAEIPKKSDGNSNDTIPCKNAEENLAKETDALEGLKNELSDIDGKIRRAKIGLIDCQAMLSDLNDTYQLAKSKYDEVERNLGFWKTAKKEPTQKVKDNQKEKEDALAKALAAWREQKIKCDALLKMVGELEARKAALPDIIRTTGESLDKLKVELEKCKKAVADEKKKKGEQRDKTTSGFPTTSSTSDDPVHPPTGAAREGTNCNPDGLVLEETVREYGSCYILDMELSPCNTSKLNNDLLNELIKWLKKLKALAKPLEIATKIAECSSSGKMVCVNIHLVRDWADVKYKFECVNGKWVQMNRSVTANGQDDYKEFVVKNLEFGNTCCWLFSDNGEKVMETKLAEAIQAILDTCK